MRHSPSDREQTLERLLIALAQLGEAIVTSGAARLCASGGDQLSQLADLQALAEDAGRLAAACTVLARRTARLLRHHVEGALYERLR